MCRSRVFDVCSTYCGTTRHSRVLDVASTTTRARPWARTTSTRPRRPLLYYYQSQALRPHDKHEATRPLLYYYQSEALCPHDKHEATRPLLYYYQSEALCPHDEHEATSPVALLLQA